MQEAEERQLTHWCSHLSLYFMLVTAQGLYMAITMAMDTQLQDQDIMLIIWVSKGNGSPVQIEKRIGQDVVIKVKTQPHLYSKMCYLIFCSQNHMF
jgi:hypothetical protein